MFREGLGEDSEFSGFHPWVNLIFFFLAIGITMFTQSPLFIAATLIVAWIYSVVLNGVKQIKMNAAVMIWSVVVFSIVTLPVEWDASSRAKQLMVTAGIVSAPERDSAGTDRNGNVEEKGQQNIQPYKPEQPVFRFFLIKQEADNGTDDHKGNVADDAPGHIAAVFQPSVLRKCAQGDADSCQPVQSNCDAAVFRHPETPQPNIIQQDIKYGHRNGGDQLSDTQSSRKIPIDKIIQNPGNEVKRVTAAQNQG